MSKRNTIEVPKGVAIGLTCLALGGVLTTVGTSFADNMTSTSTVASGNLILPYDGFVMADSTALNGSVQMKFELFESLSGVNVEWTETQTVNVYNGRFSVGLGSINSVNATILDAEKLWLAITILEDDGMGGTTEVPLSGRQAIEPAPYAAWSANAADLNVDGNADVAGSLTVGGRTRLGDSAADLVRVDGSADFNAFTSFNQGFVSQGDARINGEIRGRAYKPDFDNLDSTPGAGGAGIYNDNGSHQALMVIGNDSDTTTPAGVRKVELYDNVEVIRNLEVGDGLNVANGLQVNGSAAVEGQFYPHAIYPEYRAWAPSPIANGDAGIVNDNGAFDALMILGNRSDPLLGNIRKIEMYDNVEVTGNLRVNGKLTGAGRMMDFVGPTARQIPGASPLGINHNQGFCFLTRFFIDTNSGDSDPGACHVYVDGAGNWQLSVTENAAGGVKASNIDCEARCVRW